MSKRVPDASLFRVAEKMPTDASASSAAPDVTVVTVVFNAVKSGREREFRRCLESVQTQTGCGVEHLIVDGASKDGTVEIVTGFANRSVPIRFVSAPDTGIYEAMNRGIALARGTYVVYLNSDDRFSDPRGLAASVAALTSAGADFSYAPATVIDAEGRRVKHDFEKADESRNLFCGMTICHQTILIRRDVMVAVDGFDTAYRSAADYDLFLRIIYAGRRGVRVGGNFVEFLGGGFSTVNATLSENEVDAIFRIRFREAFGEDISPDVIRRMRVNGEYPVALVQKILAVGRAAFGVPVNPLKVKYDAWATDVRWWFRQRMPDAVWQRYAPTPLQYLRFAWRHPLHALGAVKSWLTHLGKDSQPLQKWFRIRCVFLVEGKYETYSAVYPCDLPASGDMLRQSYRGLIATDSTAVPLPQDARPGYRRLFVLLFASAYEAGERTVEMSLGGRPAGRVRLPPDSSPSWGSVLLPGVPRDDTRLELRLAGGGEFVFGGLCLCPDL